MQGELSATPLLTIDKVEKVQRQRIASFISYVFQLTYADMVDKLIQQEKLKRKKSLKERKAYSTAKSKPTFLPHDG